MTRTDVQPNAVNERIALLIEDENGNLYRFRMNAPDARELGARLFEAGSHGDDTHPEQRYYVVATFRVLNTWRLG